MPAYGSTQTIITREGATPGLFGFEDDENADTGDGQTAQEKLEAFIDDLRSRASDEVDRYCDRTFGLHENETETLHGNGTTRIQVRNYPVVTVNEIVVGHHTLDPAAYQLESTPGNPDMNAGIIERVDRRVWPNSRRITVDYDWGFEEPPGVVKAVVEDLVVEVLEKAVADRESSGKSSESMDGYSVSWDNSDVQDYLTLDESKRKRLQPLKRQGTA